MAGKSGTRESLPTAGGATASKSFEEDFAFDIAGNWLNYQKDTNGDGAFEVNQTRTHNIANGIQTISGGNTLVSHDRNGCMTKVPKPLDNTTAYTLVYDAWNRLVQVKSGTAVVATYVYDARNHRIKKTVGTVVTLSYFNQNWQEIESIAVGVTTTNVYGLRYIDDVVCRVKNTEVLYALQDTNWNVVALVTPSGVVAERITYDSFGKPTFRNANFTAKTASSYGWSKTFTGQTYDVETGLLLYRNRYYHTGLGRFITRDPIGYRGKDVNLYRYVGNIPLVYADALGLRKKADRDRYWKWWVEQHPHLSKKQLKWAWQEYNRGCVGITVIALGRQPNYKNCYSTAAEADKALDQWKENCTCGKNNPRVFSVHFWDPDHSYRPGSGNKVDMNPWLNKDHNDWHRPAGTWNYNQAPSGMSLEDWIKNGRIGVNFDYGIRDIHGDCWRHANHGEYNNLNDPMIVFGSTFEEWERGYSDFNQTVYCLQCDGGNYGGK